MSKEQMESTERAHNGHNKNYLSNQIKWYNPKYKMNT